LRRGALLRERAAWQQAARGATPPFERWHSPARVAEHYDQVFAAPAVPAMAAA
jgi:hypothetical protein